MLTTQAVVQYCERQGLETTNIGAESEDVEVLLITLIPRFVGDLRSNPGASGILVCGTGVGVEIGVNRFPGIRASLATEPQIATWARQYDNANVLCLSGWLAGENVAPILDAWFSAEFKGDEQLDRQLAAFDTWR